MIEKHSALIVIFAFPETNYIILVCCCLHHARRDWKAFCSNHCFRISRNATPIKIGAGVFKTSRCLIVHIDCWLWPSTSKSVPGNAKIMIRADRVASIFITEPQYWFKIIGWTLQVVWCLLADSIDYLMPVIFPSVGFSYNQSPVFSGICWGSEGHDFLICKVKLDSQPLTATERGLHLINSDLRASVLCLLCDLRECSRSSCVMLSHPQFNI